MRTSRLISFVAQFTHISTYRSVPLQIQSFAASHIGDTCPSHLFQEAAYSATSQSNMIGGLGTDSTMMAAVVHEAGGPEVFRIEKRQIPKPEPGQVLIRVKAFGLNRSEMFTRQGHSPTVKFPRTLGIEAAGVVEEAPGSEERLRKGDIVGTAMGGMGRDFDGGYAEYTCVPASQVQVIKSGARIPWEILGALPEMLQTTWGALFKTLRLEENDRLLIRGGTTSVGLAAAAIAKSHGIFVAATSRKPEREKLLRANGADQIFIDNGTIADQVEQSGGFNKVLEMVGVTTVDDSLQCVDEGGIVSLVGSVCNKWAFDAGWSPMVSIPTAVSLTAYHSSPKAFMETPLDSIIEQLGTETLKRLVGKTFYGLDKIVEAHRCMDEDTAGGKIVVLLNEENR